MTTGVEGLSGQAALSLDLALRARLSSSVYSAMAVSVRRRGERNRQTDIETDEAPSTRRRMMRFLSRSFHFGENIISKMSDMVVFRRNPRR